MEETNSNSMHMVIGAVLLLIGVFVVIALVLVYSQADSVTTTVTVSNADPAIDDIYIASATDAQVNSYSASGIDLDSGAALSGEVYITGTASDTNGYEDISSVSAQMYRNAQGSSCSDDNNDCYADLSCSLTSGSGNTVDFYCEVPLEYYADATDEGGRFPSDIWVAKATATDAGAATGGLGISPGSGTEVNTLMSLTIPSSIDYGSLAPGASTVIADNQSYVLTQQGNDETDVQVSSAAAMTCTTTGSIPVANQEWSTTDVDYGSGTDLTGTPADTNVGVTYNDTDGVDETGTLYWNIALPEGVKGTCSGTTTVTMLAA